MGDEIKGDEIGGTSSMYGEYEKYKPIEYIWLYNTKESEY
jgi:hypothetical protein